MPAALPAKVGTRMRHRVAVLLAALALVPAACGSGDGDQPAAQRPAVDAASGQYAAGINRAQERLTARFEQLQERVSATSTPAQDRRTLLAYERAVDTTVRELRGIVPPAGLRDLHVRLVTQVAGYGTAIRGVRVRLASGDPRTALAAQSRLAAAVQRVERRIDGTVRAINRKLEG